jgi:hypothetical protein
MNDDFDKAESEIPEWVNWAKRLWWLVFTLIIPIGSFFMDMNEQNAEDRDQNSTMRAVVDTYRSLDATSAFIINPRATATPNVAAGTRRYGPRATQQAMLTQMYGTIESRYPNLPNLSNAEAIGTLNALATPRP